MGTHLLVSSVISGLEMPPALCILLFFKSLGQQYAFLPNRSSGQCLDQSIFGMRLGHSWNSSVYFFWQKRSSRSGLSFPGQVFQPLHCYIMFSWSCSFFLETVFLKLLCLELVLKSDVRLGPFGC